MNAFDTLRGLQGEQRDEERDILGIWADDGGEGAKYWLARVTQCPLPPGRRGPRQFLLLRQAVFATRRYAQSDLRAAFDAAGYERVISHIYRKTVAKIIPDARWPESAREAADQLGHAKESMTQDNYFGPQGDPGQRRGKGLGDVRRRPPEQDKNPVSWGSIMTVLIHQARDLAICGPRGDRTHNPRIKRERVATSCSLYQQRKLHAPSHTATQEQHCSATVRVTVKRDRYGNVARQRVPPRSATSRAAGVRAGRARPNRIPPVPRIARAGRTVVVGGG